MTDAQSWHAVPGRPQTAVADTYGDAGLATDDPLGTRGLLADGITHRFAGVLALDNVSFDLRPGEIHALLGENGAGKSTLVRVITGALSPDEGRLVIDGHERRLHKPRDAQHLRIGVVHQDYHLFPNRTVAENIGAISTRAATRGGIVSRRRLDERARSILSSFGVRVDPTRKAGSLDAAERKLVEISAALLHDPAYLLLDEPTAALESHETDRLLQAIARLRDRGTGVIFITHRLGEVVEAADRASVLRDGRNAGTLGRSELTTSALAHLVVGEDVAAHEGPRHAAGPPVLEFRKVPLRPGARPVDIYIGQGELVAVVGLVGAGVSDVLRITAGVRPSRQGQIIVRGQPVSIRNPRHAQGLGVGFLAEDRKRNGILPHQSVEVNLALATLTRHATVGFTSRRRIRQAAEMAKSKLDIRCASVSQPVSTLSGGNQQKVLLGRLQERRLTVLVIEEPSQGVDIGARHQIHRQLVTLAEQGASVLFSSADLEEVRAIAHRIYVLHGGELVAEIDNLGTERPTRRDLTEAMAGAPSREKPMLHA